MVSYVLLLGLYFFILADTGVKPVEPLTRSSVFDSIRKPPSVTMEKIKNTTAAALDRMVLLQQR